MKILKFMDEVVKPVSKLAFEASMAMCSKLQ